jgi:hypothetical protein
VAALFGEVCVDAEISFGIDNATRKRYVLVGGREIAIAELTVPGRALTD